jgi:hypothetical protein
MLLVEPQPFLCGQTALTRLCVMAVHLAQHLQHVTAFLGEVGSHFYKLPPSMS